MSTTKEIKYLDESSGKAIVNEINNLRKKVDNDLNDYIKKDTSSEKLLQEDGVSRPIFDSADLNTGNNTDIPTVRVVKNESEKLLGEINKKCTVQVCDNQYEFDQILTKDNNTIYLIKGDQDQWFSKEDGDELYDFYGELRERVRHLERLNGITDYENEVEVNE